MKAQKNQPLPAGSIDPLCPTSTLSRSASIIYPAAASVFARTQPDTSLSSSTISH